MFSPKLRSGVQRGRDSIAFNISSARPPFLTAYPSLRYSSWKDKEGGAGEFIELTRWQPVLKRIPYTAHTHKYVRERICLNKINFLSRIAFYVAIDLSCTVSTLNWFSRLPPSLLLQGKGLKENTRERLHYYQVAYLRGRLSRAHRSISPFLRFAPAFLFHVYDETQVMVGVT